MSASNGNYPLGRLVDAWLDIKGIAVSECNEGDFGHPDLYHVAMRVETRDP